MFQRRGTYLQRLTKLYSDAKQSYESAKVTAASANVNDEPEVIALRRDFQIQQDRLLAWGMHWADVGPQYAGHGDVDIDKKIDQAGLGEVVASVMSEIKRLLEESGRLQHPERYELAKSGKGLRGPPSPTLHRRDWTMHEVQTGRALLDQLTTCIDVLYSLVENRDSPGKAEEKSDAKKRAKQGDRDHHDASESPDFTHIHHHPLHIDFSGLEFDPDSTPQSADPPPYDASEVRASTSDRAIAHYRTAQMPVLVDFLTSECPPHVIGGAYDVFELHELGEKLCKDRGLSWCGHLKLVGFTVDPKGPRCGMVYALPEGHGHQSLQHQRTLGSSIAATHERESSVPALEDRFRLAYNLMLSVIGYFAHGECHQYINSSNVLLAAPDEVIHTSSSRPEVRCPYLLQSCQDFISRLQTEEPFSATIYRHPDHDVRASDVVPAFDIYSLGLLLLEVGLWMPLAKLWKPKYDRSIFMERVQRVYSHKLASKCGGRYMRVVQRCLQAPAELSNKNKAEEAGAYLLEAARDLRTCCALDEDGPPPASDIECFEMLIIEQMCKTEEEEAAAEHGGGGSLDAPIMTPLSGQQETGITRRQSSKRKADEIYHPPAPPPRPPRQPEAALRKWPNIDIPQQDLDQWNTVLMPRLGKILQNALRDSPESCSLSLMMLGNTIENAKTTICIQCPNAAKVRDILRQKFKPKKGWGVVILNGDVRRSGKRRNPRRSGYRSRQSRGKSRAYKPQEQRYQERPGCGASIGAFKASEHLPPVSFGGMILVDGAPFGMTVHHMLDCPSDEDDDDGDGDGDGNGEDIITVQKQSLERPTRSAAPRRVPGQFDSSSELGLGSSEDDLTTFSDLEISDDEDDASEDSDCSTIRPDYCLTDADGHEFWFMDDAPPELEEDEGSDADDDRWSSSSSSSSSDDDDDAASVGDKVGIAPFSDDELCVTQPAIDDVDEDFFPSEEDKDEDHLASHSFGFVHASSGIRRVQRGEMKHEVDWALIRVHEDRLSVDNTIQTSGHRGPPGGAMSAGTVARPRSDSRSPQGSHNPRAGALLTTIAPLSKLSGLPVHCRGRSSGFKTGRISQALSLVKMHGRRSFSSSWCVEGGFGIPGDSGAWVYCPETGQLCGHVLAWGEKSKTAYIAPMEVLFEDIKARLGARTIELPLPSPVGAGLTRERVVTGSDGQRGMSMGVGEQEMRQKQQQQKRPLEVAFRDLRLDSNFRGNPGGSGNGSNNGNTRKRPEVGVRSLPVAGTVS